MLNTIVLALAPVFFVLALGFAAGKLRIVDNHQISGLNALVMDFALPASLFEATASASRSDLLAQGPLFAISAAVMLLLWMISYVFRRSVMKATSADAALQALTIAYPNLAGVGLPIVSSVLGPQGTVPVALALAAGSIFVTPLTLTVLELNQPVGGATSRRSAQILTAVGRSLRRPVVAAPALGILTSLCDVKLGTVLEACLGPIAHAAAGAALFLTGLILSAQAFQLTRSVVIATCMADIARPLIAAAAVAMLPMSQQLGKTTILLSAVPSGFFGILFAVNYRQDSATPGSMVIASTVFSIVTLAIAIALLFPH